MEHPRRSWSSMWIEGVNKSIKTHLQKGECKGTLVSLTLYYLS
jgi:hypothetical protein